MYKFLHDCSATVRKSLEGLDYYLAEGRRAFSDVKEAVDELRACGAIGTQEFQNLTNIILQAKRYLKTDYKVPYHKKLLF